jgi:hypothetical protein
VEVLAPILIIVLTKKIVKELKEASDHLEVE